MIYSFGNTNGSSFITLQNLYFMYLKEVVFLIYLEEINAEFINLTFSDNYYTAILEYVSTSNYIFSVMFQNITITRNILLTTKSIIQISPNIINFTLDSMEFNENVLVNGNAFEIRGCSGGFITILNSVVFSNNYLGKTFLINARIQLYKQKFWN